MISSTRFSIARRVHKTRRRRDRRTIMNAEDRVLREVRMQQQPAFDAGPRECVRCRAPLARAPSVRDMSCPRNSTRRPHRSAAVRQAPRSIPSGRCPRCRRCRRSRPPHLERHVRQPPCHACPRHCRSLTFKTGCRRIRIGFFDTQQHVAADDHSREVLRVRLGRLHVSDRLCRHASPSLRPRSRAPLRACA